ncbi:hypothetical protein OQA88_5497 [Cercophora sp. LCS_1]
MSRPSYGCMDTLAAIKNGTLVHNGITNETLQSTGWLWEGRIARLLPHVELCNNLELNPLETALNLVTNWIFPLAILFSLPYDSLHGKGKFRGTFGAVSNWLGSPQTAMTATIFNFWQILNCHDKADRGVPEDAYYTLSCFNQLILPTETGNSSQLNSEFETLFRPLRDGEDNNEYRNRDIEYTQHLLALLAARLRELRRRTVVPMMLSLGIFLGAAIISIYLAFGEAGAGIDATSLTLGLLFTWLPMIVICTIIDRNPVSSGRTREIMQRWLFNINAVREWKESLGGPDQHAEPRWWPSGSLSLEMAAARESPPQR